MNDDGLFGKAIDRMWRGYLYGNHDAGLVFFYLLTGADPEGSVEIVTAARIAYDTGLSLERVQAAIAILESPDENNPAPEDGRRIARLRNGWRVVDYSSYLPAGAQVGGRP